MEHLTVLQILKGIKMTETSKQPFFMIAIVECMTH